MEKLQALVELPAFMQKDANQKSELSFSERNQRYLQEQCDRGNAQQGNLTGYDCPACLNRGYHLVVVDGHEVARECRCMENRRFLKRVQRSGLSRLLDDCTLERFQTDKAFQKDLKASAVEFLREPNGQWFFVGGQVGAGKTHICTAMVGELLKAGKGGRYMLWRDETIKLKANVTDDYAYAKLMNPIKTTEVLYIDDLFKVARDEKGKARPPTQGDINIAFELLNYRYIQKDLITIISCEHDVDDLLDIDEAVGSRIYERSKSFCKIIGHDMKKNFRMRGSGLWDKD